jgi:hypothetical protein
MNLISILTQFDPDYNYHNLSKQSWSQIELVFGVEKEFTDIFLAQSIEWDIPYKYIQSDGANFQPMIEISNSYFLLFKSNKEVWGEDFLSTIKQFFLKRQDLGKSLKSADQISIDLITINRNVFYFLGKSHINGITEPVMTVSPQLYENFNLSHAIPKPVYFQPAVKFLLPAKFIKENNIIFLKYSDNISFNIALYTFNVLCYLYKSNNYFEPLYFSCYLNFTSFIEPISLEKYTSLYFENLYLKRDILTYDKNSKVAIMYNRNKKRIESSIDNLHQ